MKALKSLFGTQTSRSGFQCPRLGAREGPEAPAGAQTPPILSPLALSGVLPRRARLRVPSLGGPPASLTMVRPGCLERGDQGFSGGGSSCSRSSSAARPRLHTHCPQGSPPPPPPAPTVPQRPPRAPRLARPRPGRPTCRRTAAPADPSASLFASPGPRISGSHPVGVCCWPRAHAPAAGLLSVAARPTPCGHTTFLHGGGARSAARDESLCELSRYWARAMAEMRAWRRLVGPSLQCVKLGRATAWWWWEA